ncbi:MAG: respiratory nitrate reductase subunit gamma [Acidobacteriota bacterium]
MRDLLLLVALPYVALFGLVLGSIWRFRVSRFSYSALSSQVLESRHLRWGSVPWHLAILVLFLGHLIPFVMPGIWSSLVAHREFLLAVESLGVAAALVAMAGLLMLAARRLLFSRLQRVTSVLDLTVLGLLLAQIALGLSVALTHRWGSRWAPGTLTPYLWGLLTFRPDMGYVAGMPTLIKLHLLGAWVIVLLVPFTRLVHIFSLPFAYLTRPPQKVVWVTRGRLEARGHAAIADAASRRLFLSGAAGLTAAVALLSIGVAGRLVQFFRGPRLTRDEEMELLGKRLARIKVNAEERQLQLDRMRLDDILVGPLGRLNAKRGLYFTDYNMRPALAFRDDTSGLPILISAKCTHLGCTVAGQVDGDGRLLCPCHVSYFDVATGQPTPGSPAKRPLPFLGWVLRDPNGVEIARQRPRGVLEGEPSPESLATASVFIVRQYATEEV